MNPHSLITAALTSLLGGHLANTVGRPRAIALGALVFGVGAAVECASVRLAMLIVGRAVKGAGEGCFLSTIVVYVNLFPSFAVFHLWRRLIFIVENEFLFGGVALLSFVLFALFCPVDFLAQGFVLFLACGLLGKLVEMRML